MRVLLTAVALSLCGAAVHTKKLAFRHQSLLNTRRWPDALVNFYSNAGDWLGQSKDAWSTLQSIATIMALLCAAYWFFLERQLEHKIKLEQTISQRPDVADPGYVLVGLRLEPQILAMSPFLWRNRGVGCQSGGWFPLALHS